MSENQEPTPAKRTRRAWRGLFAGAAVLILVWLAALFLERYLIPFAVAPGTEPRSRVSGAGWANSNVWLLAEAAALVGLAFAGFIAQWLSPRRSWVAPAILFCACVLYVVFAQFPATSAAWRIGLWSVGTIGAVIFGAVLRRRRDAA